MHHYVALSWDPGEHALATQAARARAILNRRATASDVQVDCAGMTVYCRNSADPAMRPYVLSDNGGVIFGRLFKPASIDHVVAASELNASDIIRSRGRILLDSYWGSYVAILRSPGDNSVLVIRDCSGRLPCYYSHRVGLYIFFADIRDVEPLGFRFSLNRDYLAAYILRAPLHVRETGLREVSSLLAGDCVSISPHGVSHHALWDPRMIARDRVLKDYNSARAALISATEEAVLSWASAYDRILLKLSGGLDSAIVLGSLKRMRCSDRVVCVNLYTKNSDDDERTYARAAAAMAGTPLVELARPSDPKLFVHKLYCLPASPSPDIQKAVRMLTLEYMSEVASKFGCDTVWSGQGGDHVFLQLRTPFAAVDYAMQNPVPYRLLTRLYESASLSGQSFWFVLAQVLRYCSRWQIAPPVPFDSSGATIMKPAAIAEIPEAYTALPWRTGAGGLPPGKQTQIDIFSDLLNRHVPLAATETPYECHPLVSQPLLEVSLRIPTYHLLNGGRQRALARQAFADRVPLSILEREDKGTILDQIRALLRGSGELLREMLLDGTLVSQGIVDRASLERIVVAQQAYRAPEIFALLGCITVEAWAAHWQNR